MNKTIDINSSDEERTSILKNKTLKIVEWDKSKEITLSNANESIAHALGRYINEQEIRGKWIKFTDFKDGIQFSRTTLNESIKQMTKRHSNLINLGKLLSVVDDVCINAIRIEVEHYRHFSSAVGIDVKCVHQYISAFHDFENIYPVKITINETKKKQKNRFYMVISIGKIKIPNKIKEAITNTGVHSVNTEESLSAGDASFYLNIPQFVSYFNVEEGIIIKNLPDGLLNQEQIEIKKKIKEHDAAIEKNFANMLFSKVL